MFSKSSEYEPLIETNNPFYNELVYNADRKKRKFSYKLIIFSIAVLIGIGVLIYELYGNNGPLNPSISHLPTKTYNFVRAEQSHQHASHVPKSWDEKEECTDDHPFILTLVLKQQNTECMLN